MHSRREFLIRFAGACVTAGAAIACGGGDAPDPDPDPDPDDPDPDPGDGSSGDPPDNPMSPDAGMEPTGASCLDNGTRSAIGTNHGHELVVSIEDVRAGVARTYDITGTSDHPHTLTMTAAAFAMLQQNANVTITSSSDDGHAHVVTISCV